MNRTMMIVVCILFFLGFESVCADVPSNADINAAFSAGGTNQEVFQRFYPMLTNTFRRVGANDQELRRAQFCVLSNVLSLAIATNGNLYANFDPVTTFVMAVSDYDSVRTNRIAMLDIASYIGLMTEISTNQYAQEMAAARATTNVIACLRKWRPIQSHNSRIKEFRLELAASYSDGYKACLAALPDDQKAAFTSNVVEAARFNTEELRQLQRGIWDD